NLWSQPALPLVYAATSSAIIDGPVSSERLLSAAHEVSQQPAPVLLEKVLKPVTLDPAASTSFDFVSPTEMRGVLKFHGATILVFSQSYEDGWRLAVNGGDQSSSSHILANG